ncbi:glutathione S-transferase [Emericellopsis cladophorae]|uniref:Glutathione S-transferase n=1 Tax=Emericellopsis cladophorae TaxID=2686198 RepID=A0A9P9Y335_9HYPO|nr:glutathione S-transferase [Emericellopsis cladophorae]KAI6782606.1 glutathione S-transferase [Emericellopsis cladophorae]
MSDYTLYGYFRSSCTARVRIALYLKGVSCDDVPINLLKNEQASSKHKELNPSGTVPLLVDNNSGFKIGQSVAALEYLEETHPERSLLPKDAQARATIRQLVNIIACDTQPVTNLRIMRQVRALGGVAEDWNLGLMMDGLQAYEAVAQGCAGKYSFADEVSLADCVLVPAAWNAQRFGVDMTKFPVIQGIMKNLEELDAVKRADYLVQSDTPEELRQNK